MKKFDPGRGEGKFGETMLGGVRGCASWLELGPVGTVFYTFDERAELAPWQCDAQIRKDANKETLGVI